MRNNHNRAMAILLALALQGTDDAEVARLYAEKGDAALKASKLDEARQNYEKALQHDTSHVGALDGLATVLQEQGDVEGAVDRWMRARTILELREAPTADERKRLGEIKSKLKKYDEVAAEFRKIADALLGLGEKWMRKKMYPSARRAYEQALALDPDNEEAREALVKLDELTGGGWTDLMGAGAAWVPLQGRDVRRADGGGITLGATAEPVLAAKPDAQKLDADLRFTLKIDKIDAAKPAFNSGVWLGEAEGANYAAEGSLLAVVYRDADGSTLRLFFVRGGQWASLGTQPLKTAIADGQTWTLNLKCRAAGTTVEARLDDKSQALLEAKETPPASFRVGVWGQNADVTFTGAGARPK